MKQEFKRVMLVESIPMIRNNCVARLTGKNVHVVPVGSVQEFDERFWGLMKTLHMVVFGSAEIDPRRTIERIITEVRSAGYAGTILICAGDRNTTARQLAAGGINTKAVTRVKMIDVARAALGLSQERVAPTIRTSQDAREQLEV